MVIGQRVFSNVRFGNVVGIWEGSIVYEVLYLVFEVSNFRFCGQIFGGNGNIH